MYFLRHSADIDILPASKTMFLKDTGIAGSTSGQWISTARRSSWISLLSTESPAVAAMERGPGRGKETHTEKHTPPQPPLGLQRRSP